MNDGETVRRAQRQMPVAPDELFALLADPTRHPATDASGMVVGAVTTEPITAVGQVFTIDMQYEGRDGHVDRYRTDNHVDVFEPGRAVGWRVAAAGEPPLGWAWRYTVEPEDGGALVTLVYDWSGATAEVVEQFGVPNFDVDDLGRSLRVLESAFAGA